MTVRARKSISVTNEVRVELYHQAQYNQCVTIIDLRTPTAAYTWSVTSSLLPAFLNLVELLGRVRTTPIEGSPPSRLELGPEDFAYLNAIDDILP